MKRFNPQIEYYLEKMKTMAIKSFTEEEETTGKDIARIEISSRLLQISEYRFFHLAYEEWFGEHISEEDMKGIYSDYLFCNEVPHWARDLARNVISYYYMKDCEAREFSLN